jgi:hypothetical protein
VSLRQTRGRELRQARVPIGRPHRLEVGAALAQIGAQDLELAGGVRAQELRVEVGEVLGDQHHHHVLGQEHRVLRPLAQVDEDGAVLGRAAGDVGRRHHRLGEGQQQHHRPRRLLRRALLEVGVEQGAAVGGIARRRLRPGGAVHGVVGLEALAEMRTRLGGREAQTLGAVVGQKRRPA